MIFDYNSNAVKFKYKEVRSAPLDRELPETAGA
jgi:hypothetical protein